MFKSVEDFLEAEWKIGRLVVKISRMVTRPGACAAWPAVGEE